MKRVTKAIINLADSIAPIIGSRDLVDLLEKSISKTKADLVELDFKNVEFVSRSAAHALLTMKEDFLRKMLRKKEIAFVNANRDVKTMFRTVAANRALPNKRDIVFQPKSVDINSILSCKNC